MKPYFEWDNRHFEWEIGRFEQSKPYFEWEVGILSEIVGIFSGRSLISGGIVDILSDSRNCQ